MSRSRFVFSALVKLAAVAFSVYGMAASAMGIAMLTLFTYLSNILGDIALLISFAFDVLLYTGTARAKPNGIYVLKYISALSLTLTLAVYMFLMAPASSLGFLGAYLNNGCAGLCLHFITPTLAAADFFIFDRAYRARPVHCLYACVPPTAYLIFVFALSKAGYRWNGSTVPYSFLDYTSSAGLFGGAQGIGAGGTVALILIAFILAGELFLLLISLGRRRR